MINLDFDPEGRLLGIDIVGANVAPLVEFIDLVGRPWPIVGRRLAAGDGRGCAFVVDQPAGRACLELEAETVADAWLGSAVRRA